MHLRQLNIEDRQGILKKKIENAHTHSGVFTKTQWTESRYCTASVELTGFTIRVTGPRAAQDSLGQWRHGPGLLPVTPLAFPLFSQIPFIAKMYAIL